jgi:hypothetical protein
MSDILSPSERLSAMMIAEQLMSKQIAEGPLTPEERETLAVALDLAKPPEPSVPPCVHCGKDPYED